MTVAHPRQTATDVVFLTQGWPVYERYEFDGPEQRVIVPSGRITGLWAPGQANRGLLDDLLKLANAPPDAFLDWSRERGLFGVSHPAWREPGEPVGLIREQLGHLRATEQVLAAIELGELEGIGALVRAAAGHLVDPQRLATAAGIQTSGLPTSKRHRTEAYVAALNGLGTAIGQGLRDTVIVDAFVTGSGREVRITGAIAGRGPIATAYLYLLGESAALRVDTETAKVRVEWRMPRRCAKCGNTFEPRRFDAAWCSARCRWLASKQGIKNPYREDG
jgi:hypothetical protein